MLGRMASTARRGRPPGTERRRELLHRAAALFDQAGYHSTTLDDIAEASGIHKPTVYHYFTGKDDLLFWIHDEFIELLLGRHEARLRTPMPVHQMLLETMGDILELMETHRGHVRVFFEHHRELPDERRASIDAKRDRYQALVEDLIRQGVESGEFRDVDAHLAAFALFGMCNWAYQWYSSEGPLRTREIAYAFWDLLLHGLDTPSTRTAS